MENETYKKAKEILEKFDPNQIKDIKVFQMQFCCFICIVKDISFIYINKRHWFTGYVIVMLFCLKYICVILKQ